MKAGNLTGNGTLTVNFKKAGPGSVSMTTIDSQTIDLTSSNDYDIFFLDFDSDAILAPGDLYTFSVQSSADLSGNTYWYFNIVFKWDYSSLIPHQTIKS